MPADLLPVVACALAAGVLAGLRQSGRLRRSVPGRTQGDEREYLLRCLRIGSYRDDPFAPEPFLRPPLMTLWGGMLLIGGPSVTDKAQLVSPVRRLRRGMSALGIVVVLATVLLAGAMAGPVAALVCALALVSLEERATLAVCVWPDALLAAGMLVVTFGLWWSGQDGVVAWWTVGIGVALAAMARIDGLALAAGASFSWFLLDGAPIDLLAVWLPATLGLLAWSWRSWRRYGVFLPDTTFAFNLLVLQQSQAWDVRPSVEEDAVAPAVRHPAERVVETTVIRSKSRWDEDLQGRGVMPPRTLTLVAAVLGSPIRLLAGWLGRVRMLFGPDSFGREIVLGGWIFGDCASVSHWRRLQFWQVPLLVALLVGTTWMGSQREAAQSGTGALWIALLPALALALAATLAHTRTRYRHALLPALTLALGVVVSKSFETIEAFATTDWLWAAALSAVTFAILVVRSQHEVAEPGGSLPG